MGFGLGGPIPAQPSCRVGGNTAVAINSGVTLPISFTVERWDTDNIWDASAPTRLTCRTPGKYNIGGTVHFQPLANQAWGTMWDLPLRLNGSTYIQYGREGGFATTNGTTVSVSVSYDLKVGDYLELVAINNSGVNGNIYYGSGWSPEFWMTLEGGVPGPPGVGVPTPVVNGQWIKGSGGAAIWSPITYADLPAPLGQYGNGYLNYVSDLNNCTTVGWYAISPSTTNRPADIYGVCETLPLFDTSNVRQIVWQYNSENAYTRRKNDGGAWGGWRQFMGNGALISWNGPYSLYSGQVPSGSYTNQTYTHNLGRAADVFTYWLTDASWGMNITVVMSSNGANSTNWYFGNHADIGGGSGSSTNACYCNFMVGWKA